MIAVVYSGELDGIRAQLIRWTNLGYTVELLESKGVWKKGDILRLSSAEFHIERQDTTPSCVSRVMLTVRSFLQRFSRFINC